MRMSVKEKAKRERLDDAMRLAYRKLDAMREAINRPDDRTIDERAAYCNRLAAELAGEFARTLVDFAEFDAHEP